MVDEEQVSNPTRDPVRNARIAEMRDAGSSWLEIQEAFGLTRQQARYAYQLARREERRRSRPKE